MAVSIKSCPSCNTLLLSDTVQCPSCKHVLNTERYEQFPEQELFSEKKTDTEEKACPSCGEQVRSGLVRCWNCGGFMREEIADSYQKMRETTAPVIYSQLPDNEIEDRSDEQTGVAGDGSLMASDDDFVPDEDDYEVAVGVTVTRPPTESHAESDAYNLAGSSADASDADETKQESSPPTDDAGDSEDMQQDAENKTNPGNKDEQPQVSHSEATGGDALLQVALDEEAETQNRRTRGPRRPEVAKPRYPDGILIYCPNGHRVEVRDRHRGMTGRCPRCKSPFFVPEKIAEPAPEQQAATAAEAAQETAATPGGAYSCWLPDMQIHTVNRKKLKLKPGSLEKDFELFDLGFSADALLAVKLPVVKVSKKKKGEEAEATEVSPRDQMLAHLGADKPLEELPAEKHHTLDSGAVQNIKIAQPIVYAHESMFAGVPVFGDGRIAVWLPGMEEDGNPRCASFALSQFREFSTALNEIHEIDAFGEDCGVPLKDEYTEQKCAFSDEPVKALKSLEFYQADPSYTLELQGWQCEGCSIVVSEDARKKEKIGGPKPQSVPKAKCPKCKKKLGNNPMYVLAETQGSDALDEE